MIDKIISKKSVLHICIYISIFLVIAIIATAEVIAYNKNTVNNIDETIYLDNEWAESTEWYWNTQLEVNRGESGPQMYFEPGNDANNYKSGYALKVNMYEQIFDGVNVESVYVGSYFWVVKNK